MFICNKLLLLVRSFFIRIVVAGIFSKDYYCHVINTTTINRAIDHNVASTTRRSFVASALRNITFGELCRRTNNGIRRHFHRNAATSEIHDRRRNQKLYIHSSLAHSTTRALGSLTYRFCIWHRCGFQFHTRILKGQKSVKKIFICVAIRGLLKHDDS